MGRFRTTIREEQPQDTDQRFRCGPLRGLVERKRSQETFRTAGIRGVANVDPMTAELALQLGRAIAHVCRAGSAGTRS